MRHRCSIEIVFTCLTWLLLHVIKGTPELTSEERWDRIMERMIKLSKLLSRLVFEFLGHGSKLYHTLKTNRKDCRTTGLNMGMGMPKSLKKKIFNTKQFDTAIFIDLLCEFLYHQRTNLSTHKRLNQAETWP